MSFQVLFKPVQKIFTSVQVAKSMQAILFTVVAQNVTNDQVKYIFQLYSTALFIVALKLLDNRAICVQVASNIIALLHETDL